MLVWVLYPILVVLILATSYGVANRIYRGQPIENKTVIDRLTIIALPALGVAAGTPFLWTILNGGTAHFRPISQNWLVLGTWLSGILTPASLLITFRGIRDQNVVAQQQIQTAGQQITLISQQIAEQQAANKIAASSLFNSSIEIYEKNLNHLAGLVIEELSGNRNQYWADWFGVAALTRQLKQDGLSANLFPLEQICSRQSYSRFCNELERVIKLAELNDSLAMVNHWFLGIYPLAKQHPPKSIDP